MPSVVAERHRVLGMPDRGLEIAPHERAVRGDRDHDRRARVLLEARHRHRRLGPRGHLVPHPPERVLPHRRHEAHRAFDVAEVDGVPVRLAEVVEVAVEPRDAVGFVGPTEADGVLACHAHVPREVTRPGLVPLAALGQAVEPELSQRLEEPVPRLFEIDDLHHRLVDEVGEQVGDIGRVVVERADVLGRVEVEAADERGQPHEQSLLVGRQQLVRPLERVAQRAMAVVRAALRGTEHAHPSAQAFRERGRAQRAHPRRGELQARAAGRRAGDRSPRSRPRSPR